VAYSLGLRPGDTHQKLNVSKADTEDSEKGASRELLEELNATDLVLYEAARKKFASDHATMSRALLEARYDEVYRNSQMPKDSIVINFSQAISGTGWHQREHAEGVGLFKWSGFLRWTGPTAKSELDLPLATDRAYRLEIDVVDHCSPEALAAAEIRVNGRPVRHSLRKTLRVSRLVATLPESVLEGRWPVRLAIFSGAVQELDSRPRTDIDHNAGRLCGLAIARIQVRPA
jgi:hypothetical protein